MALQKYEVAVGNRRGQTTAVLKLNEKDAERLGAKPLEEKAAKAPANKARRAPANKAAKPKTAAKPVPEPEQKTAGDAGTD
ncbi:hypothetical protein OVA14_07195 [Agrococcus sp. SL85]|uniref:hypothetical protein n=1 Tax=Agrococcus sp. SL85 TaxID=2995141 RepID=UPI00226D10D5|nr:hypothetical protein [Agrococcus sp. SL85]WAC65178.1 hypothetical protein OVA14_07195 [Agrococcus sp. SL85]